jgi:general secretion pathway protein I
MVRRGFSLLEVMVAIAILGLTLTVILSAQGGLAASNRSAANMGQAVALARCKMTELEENLLKLGYPEIDQVETAVPCCEDEKTEVFACETKVEKIELPNLSGGNSLGDGGALIGANSALSGLGPNNAGGGPGLDLSGDGGLQGLGAQLQNQLGAAGGASGLLNMVMSMLYPSLKPMFEMSIRRLTVTVRWKEGPNERELPIVQFVTNPQRAGFAGNALLPDGGAMDFAPVDPKAAGSATPQTGGGAGPGAGAGTGGGITR